jgi:hypothetical protein
LTGQRCEAVAVNRLSRWPTVCRFSTYSVVYMIPSVLVVELRRFENILVSEIKNSNTFVFIWQTLSNYKVTRFKKFISWFYR